MANHKCPAPNCTVDVPQTQLACRRHWFSLPKVIRERVWLYWRSGNREKHQEAVLDATYYLNAKETPS